jgi:hypothetical protein
MDLSRANRIQVVIYSVRSKAITDCIREVSLE